MRAVSWLGTAKPEKSYETETVEPVGAGRQILNLTWGDLPVRAEEKSAEAVVARKPG